MTKPTSLRSFQDIRDVASETIRQVGERSLTGDQVKSIQGLLTLAADTIVKEEAINRAIVANTSNVPGVPATTTPPPRGTKNTDGTFILNINANSYGAPSVEFVEHRPAPTSAPAPSPAPPLQIEVWDEEPPAEDPPERAIPYSNLSGEEAAAHLGEARAAAHDDIADKRRNLVERLRAQREGRR